MIPRNITQEEELFQSLDEQLHFPAYFGRNWHSLDEELSFWAMRSETQRAVIIHQDLPFVGQVEHGWYWLKIYLKILIKNIVWIKEHAEKELTVVFPSGTAEALSDVLAHPPVWELEISFCRQSINVLIDPSWSEIARYVGYLNGLTTEACTIFREDVGAMTVHYLRKTKEYWVECSAQAPLIPSFIASVDENAAFPAGLSFSQACHIFEEFFLSGQRSTSMYWLAFDPETREKLEYLSYLNDEEAFLEGREQTIRATIIYEILNTPLDAENIFSLDYWKNVLLNQDTPVSLRVTALCVVGSSDLPDKSALLFPFLRSSHKKERWVSAVFLGMLGDERVIPSLLGMLADELPIVVKESWSEQDHWYEDWRPYAPRVLRKWHTVDVLRGLQNALTQWVQAEPSFDPEYDFWRAYEAELCYELGYRGDLTTWTQLALEEDHRHGLMIDTVRGYLVASKKMSLFEEYLQQNYFWTNYRLIQGDLIDSLVIQFGLSLSEARRLVEEYCEKNEYTF